MFSPPPSTTATESQQRNFSTIPSISFTPSSTTNNNKSRYNGTPYPSRSHSPHTPRSTTTTSAVDTPSSSPRRFFVYKASPSPPLHVNNNTSPGLSLRNAATNANRGPTAATLSSSTSPAGRNSNNHDIRTSFDVDWKDIGDKGSSSSSSSFGLRRRTPGGGSNETPTLPPASGATTTTTRRTGAGTPPPTTSLAFVEPLFAGDDAAVTTTTPSITSPSSNTTTHAASHQSLDPSDDATIPQSHCIIVYGFSPSHRHRILSLFATYGTILSHYPSNDDDNSIYNTNWVCLRYKSRLQAENALCHDGTIHVETTDKDGGDYRRIILGVRRWDAELIKQMGLVVTNGTDGASSSSGWSDDRCDEGWRNDTTAAVTARDVTSRQGRENSRMYSRVSPPPDVAAVDYDEMNDKDILLNGDKDSVNNAASDLLTSRKRQGGGGGICSLILKWIFMW